MIHIVHVIHQEYLFILVGMFSGINHIHLVGRIAMRMVLAIPTNTLDYAVRINKKCRLLYNNASPL